MRNSGAYFCRVSCDTNEVPHAIYKVMEDANLRTWNGKPRSEDLIPVGMIYEDTPDIESELFTAHSTDKLKYTFAYAALGEKLPVIPQDQLYGDYLCHTNPNSAFVDAMGEVAKMIDQITRDL